MGEEVRQAYACAERFRNRIGLVGRIPGLTFKGDQIFRDNNTFLVLGLLQPDAHTRLL